MPSDRSLHRPTRRGPRRAPSRGTRVLLLFLPLVGTLGQGGARGEDPPEFDARVLPLLKKYCHGCHNAEEEVGELNLERFLTLEDARRASAIFSRSGTRLRNREMPPRGAPRPTDEEREELIRWTESLQVPTGDCDQIPSDESQGWFRGHVMSRRLNRVEYETTIRDLLGVRMDLRSRFPADGAGGEGFDNFGDALYSSSILVEKYLDAADAVVRAALPEREHESLEGALREMTRAATLADPAAFPPGPLAGAVRGLVERAADPADALRHALADIMPRAFRRPVEPEELERHVRAGMIAVEEGDSLEEGLRTALKAVLVSPHFLFLAEPEAPTPGVHRLGDFPLASRLSYFLWSSMPDDELLAVAARGGLADEATLVAQTRRMLADPRARGFAENFGMQWLELQALGGAVRPDAARFPEFDDALAADMREETVRLLERVFRENRSVLDLIDARYTFANDRLARIYGFPDVEGADFRLVELPDRRRGGVLGMASVLTATSQSLRTSPVVRGKWVLERVLGERIPPPPPNVGTIPADDRDMEGLSMRERMAVHRANPECASCHQTMDPIGLGLENFDPIGRWRDEQGGKPVDATGELPSGEKFSTPEQLKDVILARKDGFLRNLARKVTGYALGREITQFDQCVVDRARKALEENDGSAWSMIEAIVTSYPFLHRHSHGGSPEAAG